VESRCIIRVSTEWRFGSVVATRGCCDCERASASRVDVRCSVIERQVCDVMGQAYKSRASIANFVRCCNT
jgi:hypothetical protein